MRLNHSARAETDKFLRWVEQLHSKLGAPDERVKYWAVGEVNPTFGKQQYFIVAVADIPVEAVSRDELGEVVGTKVARLRKTLVVHRGDDALDPTKLAWGKEQHEGLIEFLKVRKCGVAGAEWNERPDECAQPEFPARGPSVRGRPRAPGQKDGEAGIGLEGFDVGPDRVAANEDTDLTAEEFEAAKHCADAAIEKLATRPRQDADGNVMRAYATPRDMVDALLLQGRRTPAQVFSDVKAAFPDYKGSVASISSRKSKNRAEYAERRAKLGPVGSKLRSMHVDLSQSETFATEYDELSKEEGIAGPAAPRALQEPTAGAMIEADEEISEREESGMAKAKTPYELVDSLLEAGKLSPGEIFERVKGQFPDYKGLAASISSKKSRLSRAGK